MFFRAKIRYQKINESGKPVAITEAYLVDAVSWTDVEAILYTELAEVHDDFSIKGIVPVQFADVFPSEQEPEADWYKCKVTYETEDAKGRPKKIVNTMLAQASSVTGAEALIRENLKTMLVPFSVEGAGKTDYLEILKARTEAEAV